MTLSAAAPDQSVSVVSRGHPVSVDSNKAVMATASSGGGPRNRRRGVSEGEDVVVLVLRGRRRFVLKQGFDSQGNVCRFYSDGSFWRFNKDEYGKTVSKEFDNGCGLVFCHSTEEEKEAYYDRLDTGVRTYVRRR